MTETEKNNSMIRKAYNVWRGTILLGPVCLDLYMYLGSYQRPAQPAFCHSSSKLKSKN